MPVSQSLRKTGLSTPTPRALMGGGAGGGRGCAGAHAAVPDPVDAPTTLIGHSISSIAIQSVLVGGTAVLFGLLTARAEHAGRRAPGGDLRVPV
jgi:hypothetical protein